MNPFIGGLAVTYIILAIVNFIEIKGYKLPTFEMLFLSFVALVVASFDLYEVRARKDISDRVKHLSYAGFIILLISGLIITYSNGWIQKIADILTVFSFAIILFTIGIREKNKLNESSRKMLLDRPLYNVSSGKLELEFFDEIIKKGHFNHDFDPRVSFDIRSSNYFTSYIWFTLNSETLIDGQEIGVKLHIRFHPEGDRIITFEIVIDKMKLKEWIGDKRALDKLMGDLIWLPEKHHVVFDDKLTEAVIKIKKETRLPIEEYALLYSDFLSLVKDVTGKIR